MWLEGRWIASDSYIVDAPLFTAARTQLQLEGRTYGYGVHVARTTNWDGYGSAFSQYVQALRDGSTRYKPYEDVQAFYAAFRPQEEAEWPAPLSDTPGRQHGPTRRPAVQDVCDGRDR